MHGLDERGAGGGVDDKVAQCPQRSAVGVDFPNSR